MGAWGGGGRGEGGKEGGGGVVRASQVATPVFAHTCLNILIFKIVKLEPV